MTTSSKEAIQYFKQTIKEDTNFALGYLNLAFVRMKAHRAYGQL